MKVPKEIRVLICGDRNWKDYNLIERTIFHLMGTFDEIVVIEGAARGADSMAAMAVRRLRPAAEKQGFKLTLMEFPADWQQYGKAAGPIRNKQMLVEGRPDLVIAFHSDIQNSRGTANMLHLAEKAGVETQLITGVIQ